MNIEPIGLHVALIAIAVAIALSRLKIVQRESASFDMYASRDEFVLLVAKGILKESDPVFQHYYNRINDMLLLAPNVGLQNVLEAMLNSSKADFEAMKTRHERIANEVLASESAQIPEVDQAIRNYYKSVVAMMQSHSDTVKVTYIVARDYPLMRSILRKASDRFFSRNIKLAVYLTTKASQRAHLTNGNSCGV